MTGFDIDEYNKAFSERTKNYTKICKGKPCQYVNDCEENGNIVFCNEDNEKGELHYIKGRVSMGIISFKNVCRRDDFTGKFNTKALQKLWDIWEPKFPEMLPQSIDAWVEELREMELFED